jgi:hypothetical protein
MRRLFVIFAHAGCGGWTRTPNLRKMRQVFYHCATTTAQLISVPCFEYNLRKLECFFYEKCPGRAVSLGSFSFFLIISHFTTKLVCLSLFFTSTLV